MLVLSRHMGIVVDFKCGFCKYEETNIGVGRGKNEFPFLVLFRCDNCKSIGSTWVYDKKIPLCSICYHDEIIILPDDTRRLNCPKCGEPAVITPRDETWE